MFSNFSGKDPSKDTPTIIFLSGFPDTSDSWSRLAVQFESSHVVTLAMPDYEAPELRRFWGYSIPDMVNGLAAVIEPHLKRGSPIYLVGHDWGAFICIYYVATYPKTVNKLVLLDIGLRDKFDLVSMCYMTYLSIVFLVSRVSDVLGLVLVGLYPWKAFGPCPYEVRFLFARILSIPGFHVENCCANKALTIFH